MKSAPPKFLSTREAWLELALWWDNTSRCKCGCGRMVAASNAAGLCASLAILKFRKLISESQEDQMLASLPIVGNEFVPGVRPFCWPTDEAGAKQRAEFCREQADRNRNGK
jgi:hypothetical protein